MSAFSEDFSFVVGREVVAAPGRFTEPACAR